MTCIIVIIIISLKTCDLPELSPFSILQCSVYWRCLLNYSKLSCWASSYTVVIDNIFTVKVLTVLIQSAVVRTTLTLYSSRSLLV